MKILIKDININYEVSGVGPPLIFLHGWGLNLEEFDKVADQINEDFKVYQIDLPGFGKSEINKEDYDEEIKASYLEKLQLQIQESQMARLCDSYKEKSLVELTVILGKIVASNFDFEIVSKYYKIIKDRIVDLKLNEKYWIYDKYVSNLEYISNLEIINSNILLGVNIG